MKMENFERWKTSPGDQAIFMQRVAEGETPKAICAAQELPHSMVMRHVKGTTQLYGEYRSALETWVESLAHETVQISDDAAGAEDSATVAAAKLRCDTRFKIASKLYKEMFGEDVKPALNLTFNVGDVAREIRELEQRLGLAAATVLTLPASVPEDASEEAPI